MICKTLNIGILGATEVANRVIISNIDKSDNVFVYGIASRDENRAKEFASKYQIPHVFADYHSLLNSPDIDVVYIPLISKVHALWACEAAKVKKHVLVEKPICLNEEEVNSIQQSIEKYNVKIIEGVMVQHHPWQDKLKEKMNSNCYGKLISILTEFSYPFSRENLQHYKNKGGGVFIHDSVYWLQLVQNCCGLQVENLKGRSKFDGPNEIDAEFEAQLTYSTGVSSLFKASFEKPFKAKHSFKFEDACVIVNNFLKPSFGHYKIVININYKKSQQNEKIVFPAQNFFKNQLKYLYDAVNGLDVTGFQADSLERVKVMAKIYQDAKNNCKNIQMVSTSKVETI